MKNLFIQILFIFSAPCLLYSQVDTVGNFIISSGINKVSFFNIVENKSLELYVENPSLDYNDFDDDGMNEVLIIGQQKFHNITRYFVLIYKVDQYINLIDSIMSGVQKPELIFSNEAEQVVLAVGYSEFDTFNFNSKSNYSPIRLLNYDGEQFFVDFEDFFDILLKENDEIFAQLDDDFSNNGLNCSTTSLNKAAIGALYINYLNAGEKAMAEHVLDSFYFCNDRLEFTTILKNILTE